MTTQEYKIPDIVQGDTLENFVITLTEDLVPMSLVNAQITMSIKMFPPAGSTYTLTVGHGITILDGAAGIFQIDNVVINYPVGYYKYHITVRFANGEVLTILQGAWEITNG